MFSQTLTRDARIDKINNFSLTQCESNDRTRRRSPRCAARVRHSPTAGADARPANRLDAAGGDGFLAVIGIVFIVLLILELTGVINIFKILTFVLNVGSA